jgi:hypothetical protein
LSDGIQSERIFPTLRQNDRLSFWANSSLGFFFINVMSPFALINKDRHRSKLQNWIYGCWKTYSHPDDFITF